jgi:hypothetical protein
MHSRKREPTSKRNFIAKFTDLPAPAAVDTTIPAFGQRKRKAKSRAPLRPNPSKAD